MIISKNINLGRYADGAQEEFAAARSKIDSIEKQITSQLGGRSSGRMSLAVIAPVIYALICFALFIAAIKFDLKIMLGLIAYVSTIIFAAVMFADALSKKTHYSSVFKFRSRLSSLRDGINSAEAREQKIMDGIIDKKEKGWEYALPFKPSVIDEIWAISSSLGRLHAVERGGLNKLKNILYYAVTVIITVVGEISLYSLALAFVSRIFPSYSISEDTLRILMIIGAVIALVGVILLAKLIWGRRVRVTAGAMMFTIAGPAIYMLFMIIVTVLAYLIINVVIPLVIGAIALIVAYVCCCGG